MKKFNVTYGAEIALLSVKANAVLADSFQPNFIKGFDTCKITVDGADIILKFIVNGAQLTKEESIADVQSYDIFDLTGIEDINISSDGACDIEVTFLKSNR